MSHRRLTTTACVLLVMAGAAACDGGSGPSTSPAHESPSVTPSPTIVESGRCPNEAALVRDEAATRPPALIGDTDGDGSSDRTTVRIDPEASEGCTAAVVVEAATAIYSAPLDLLDPGAALSELGVPAARSLTELNGADGAEIIVTAHVGASTEFVAVFTIANGRLVRMSVDRDDDDLFGFGGSVGHLEAVDCTPAGDLLVTIAAVRGRGYVITRSLYAPETSSFRLNETERSFTDPDGLADYPDLHAPPFGTCPAP